MGLRTDVGKLSDLHFSKSRDSNVTTSGGLKETSKGPCKRPTIRIRRTQLQDIPREERASDLHPFSFS